MSVIRPPRDDDAAAVRAMHEAAFDEPVEAKLVDLLRASGGVGGAALVRDGLAASRLAGYPFVAVHGDPACCGHSAPLAPAIAGWTTNTALIMRSWCWS